MIITAGKINVTVDVYFVDDDGGTAPGEPTTGLLFSDIETGGSASYHRQGAARVDFTLITQTVAGVHADGGFIEIDSVNMPGLYRLDVPDAAFATGVDYVVIQLVAAGANNTMMRPLLIDLTDVDLRDSVRGGMTALPNAAADAAGGLATSAGGATGIDDLATAASLTTAQNDLDIITGAAGVIIDDSAANDTTMSDAIWDEDATGHQTQGTFGQAIGDPVADATTIYQAVATDAAGDNVSIDVIAVQADTDDIQARLPAALVNSRMDSNISSAGGITQSGTNFEASVDTILIGIASGTPTTTTMVSDIGITVDDQFNGRTIIFASDTTTAALRGQATDITGCTAATNTLTFTALTTAPVSGDTFVIV